MAKSESTAVNALIDLVRSGKPVAPEAADDLFAAPKPLHPPRMTSTVPPLRGAGEVEPLPRVRAPTGTSQLQVGNQIRMSTAPPSRATTIPPLPQARGAKAPPPPHRASAPALAQRPSQPLPAPVASTVAPSAQRAASPSPDAVPGTPSRPGLPAPVREAAARTTGAQRTVPPSTTPVAAPFEGNPLAAIPQYPVVARTHHAIDRTGDAVSADHWFEASRAVEKVDETWVGTRPAPRRRDPAAAVKRAAVPLVALATVGFGVGYLVFHTATRKHAAPATPPIAHVAAPAAAAAATTAAVAAPSTESPNAATATAGATQPEPPAPGSAPSIGPADPNVPAHPNANEVKIVAKSSDETPAPAAAPAPAPAIAETARVAHEVPTTGGTAKLVDVRIDSTPSGATVMLVDNGNTTFLGKTPVAASVDPSHGYDIVLTLEGRPAQMTHLDPTKTTRLDVTLGSAPKAAAPAVRTASAPRSETPRKRTKHVASSRPTGGLVDPGFDAPAASHGEGTLMVSAKPPCEIWIDGKDTGMKTPQRSISLASGLHKVTFSNADEHITKTVAVKITADQTTKLIQDLMNK